MRWYMCLIVLVLIMHDTTCKPPRPQRKDFLDNCDWCVDKSKYNEPLDIGEWYMKCKRVAKPIWFNHEILGRVHGTGVQIQTNNWLYTKRHGWVYIVTTHRQHFYIHNIKSWVYIESGMLYNYSANTWSVISNK